MLLLLLVAQPDPGIAAFFNRKGEHKAESQNYDENTDSKSDKGFVLLIDWMKKNGGRVDDRFNVTQLDGGVRGGVATKDIEQGAELLHCPWNLVIGSNGINDQMSDMCDVVKAIDAELRLGNASLWYPYLDLHHESLLNTRLPTLWGPAARKELQGLPPSEDAQRHTQWLESDCGGRADDPLTQEALLCFVTRATAVGMVPIYDLFNHHNGERNVKLQLSDTGVQLVALDPIRKGEQIFLSYGVKSVSTMYRDYGFVESWPQIWTWTEDSATKDRHTFALFPPIHDHNGNEVAVAALYPSKEILSKFWQGHAPLPEFQTMAKSHTLDLPQDLLHRFRDVATALLKGLPTSVKEDQDILKDMKKSETALLKKSDVNDDSGLGQLQDSISAVEYRIAFKESVNAGLVVSEAALESKVGRQNIDLGEELW